MIKRIAVIGLMLLLIACDEPVRVVNAPQDTLEVVDTHQKKLIEEAQARHHEATNNSCDGNALCEEVMALRENAETKETEQ